MNSDLDNLLKKFNDELQSTMQHQLILLNTINEIYDFVQCQRLIEPDSVSKEQIENIKKILLEICDFSELIVKIYLKKII